MRSDTEYIHMINYTSYANDIEFILTICIMATYPNVPSRDNRLRRFAKKQKKKGLGPDALIMLKLIRHSKRPSLIIRRTLKSLPSLC